MDFLAILSEIEKLDPEMPERLDSRRAVFKHMSGLGQKLTATALPLAVGAIFNKAYAQTSLSATINDVLNFALKLEYLEYYFYLQRSSAASTLSPVHAAALTVIANDELNHVRFLRSVLGSAAAADPTIIPFDYSAGGIAAGWQTNSTVYLAVAQTLEDLGVRAYKGAVPVLATNKTILTAALSIHSVEARHAAHIREMRRAGINSTTPSQSTPQTPYNVLPKSWISDRDNGGSLLPLSAAVLGAGQPSTTYPAEDNTTQAGINLRLMSTNVSGFPGAAFTEAFDEGFDSSQAASIARAFVKPGYFIF